MYIDPEFLRQVDNVIRFDLQSWRDLFFHLLIWSSVFVAIGVALEGPEVIHEVRNIWRLPKLEAPSWIKLVGLLGWILVVGGVAGEGVFEGALSVSDGQIQTFDEILLANAQRQAGDAADSAERANTAAGDAKTKAESADAAAGNAVAKSDQATHEVDAFHAELHDSEIILREHIEAIANPRHLRDEEDDTDGNGEVRKARYAEVKKYPRTRVLIQVFPENKDASDLADDIVLALRSAGWNPRKITEDIGPWLIPRGVLIETQENPDFVHEPPPDPKLPPVDLSEVRKAASALKDLLDLDLGRDSDKGRVGVRLALNNSEPSMHTLRTFRVGTIFILVGRPPVENLWSSNFLSPPHPDINAKPSKKSPKNPPSAKP
jgi:hypothetical protein